MHQNYYGNNLFAPENFKYVEINKQPAATCDNFLNGVLNAKNILCSLERSLKKTQNYEDQLLKCQCKHFHTTNEQHVFSNKNDSSEEKCVSSRSSEDLANDWASMNVVCLKYHYEELSARYDVLLREYDERCNLETSHKETISRLRNRMKRNHTNLIEANKALLAVGEKYMKLRQKKLIEKEWFEHRIEQLKQRIEDVVRTAERARLELDDQLNNCHEDNVSLSLLVEEVLLRLYYSEEDTKQMKSLFV
ncbi:unnamed protein product [Pieris macdunnoughi]|uniref:Uncharacterized protein n=1 Tax=Pieris macdunnoughi TaxID=345717 RepID=A0A821LVP3_9NEOP|nr:unnamed protein product [Pieris macdunnoughi]